MVAIQSACFVLALAMTNAMATEVAGKSTTMVTPVQKVITLMEEMLEKSISMKNEEEKAFAVFNQWCIDTKRVKNVEITAGKETIEKQKAVIQKAEVKIAKLTDRIMELEEDVGRWKQDTEAATDVRNKEKVDYEATVADFSESIDAIGKAIVVLKKQSADKPQAELLQSLLQVRKAKNVPMAVRGALAAFLQQPNVEAMPDAELSYEAPEANAYEFQSGGVVDMLQKLEVEFKSKKMDLVKEEMMAQHKFEDLIQSLTDNTEIATNEISKKTANKGKTMELKANTEADKAVAEEELADDTKYLEDTTALCEMKTTDFNSRQELRGEEIETIKKAIEIMKSDAVSAAAEKYLPTFVQMRKEVGSVLAQVRNNNESPELRAKVAAFLSKRAKLSGSRLLAQLEQHVAAGDPFTKVKKMIKELIWKLTEEATAEVEDKGWCDAEVSANTMTRKKKTEDIATLNAEIEALNAKIVKLTQEIADLATAVQELDASVAKATKERLASKAENEQTIADAKGAIAALEAAKALVKDFWTKSAKATALVQQMPAEDAPETFTKPYKGLLPEGASVVDFLNVILTDFTRLEQETSAAEASEAAEYKKFMKDAELDRAMKENEKGHKENSKADAETTLAETKKELKMTQSALEKAEEYYEKLKPKCIDSGITYEQRVKDRESEIDSLQEALKILTGVDIAE